MPQMAPISWLILFFVFSITFVMFNILNYYIFIYQPMTVETMTKKSIKSLSWKW